MSKLLHFIWSWRCPSFVLLNFITVVVVVVVVELRFVQVAVISLIGAAGDGRMSDSSPLLLRTDSQSTEQNEIESTSTPVRQFSDQEGEFSSFVPMAPLAASKQGKKRSMEFHDLFKSISVEEELLDCTCILNLQCLMVLQHGRVRLVAIF